VDRLEALEQLRLDRNQEPEDGPTRRRPWRLLGLAVLAAILAGGGFLGWHLLQSGRPTVVAAAVDVTDPGAPGAVLNASGYIVAKQQATVAAQITGLVTEVTVQEGQHVKSGEILAQLDASSAKAAVAAAQQQYEADNVALPQYRAQFERDVLNQDRYRTLSKGGAIPQQTLESAEAAVKVDAAILAHARQQVAVDRAAVDIATIQLSYTVIRAPFDGVVTARYAHPGEMISPAAVGGFTQTGICTIVDMSSLEIDVDVAEAYISRVQPGQHVIAVLDAYPSWEIPGHVIAVVPTADQQKATVKARIAIDVQDPRILPQMSTQVRFEGGSGTERAGPAVLTVPAAALHRDGASSYVLRIDGDVVRRVAVRATPAGGDRMRIVSGLSPGDRVVVQASGPLSDGEEVQEQ
jgi:RND family efflux transporter MFP subunit